MVQGKRSGLDWPLAEVLESGSLGQDGEVAAHLREAGSPGTNQLISNVVLSNHCLPRTLWAPGPRGLGSLRSCRTPQRKAKGECSHTAC